MLCCVMLCYVMLCYVMLCYVMLYYVMLCYVMLCYVLSCYVPFASLSPLSLPGPGRAGTGRQGRPGPEPTRLGGGTILRRHGSPEWSKSLIKLNQNWGFWDFAESRSSRWNTFRFPKIASENGEIVLEKGCLVSGKCLRIYHFNDFKEINLVR